MDGTTHLGENYSEIDVALVLLKVYNRVPKMRGIIFPYNYYYNILNDVTPFIEYLQGCSPRISFHKTETYLKYIYIPGIMKTRLANILQFFSTSPV